MNAGLTDKTILITGAAGGIGSECVRSFLAEGANVAIHFHKNRKNAEALAAKAPTAAKVLLVKGDLTDEPQVEKIFSEVEKRFRQVDGLVANAAIYESQDVPLHRMSLAQWERTLRSNLTAVFLCVRRHLQSIERLKIETPSIVLVGSTAGLYGEAGHADYATSKSALLGLMLTIKNELARLSPCGRINMVSPSWVLTPMAADFAKDTKAITKTLQTVALRKLGRPLDVANAICFLASPNLAGHLSGHNLVLAGGMEGRVLYDPTEIEPTIC